MPKDHELVAASSCSATARHQVQSVASPSSQEGGRVLDLSHGGKVILYQAVVPPKKLITRGKSTSKVSKREKRGRAHKHLLVECEFDVVRASPNLDLTICTSMFSFRDGMGSMQRVHRGVGQKRATSVFVPGRSPVSS